MNTRLAVFGCTLVALALTGCDPIGYGYVNRLNYPVTVVHHVGGEETRFTLAPGARKLPAIHDWLGDREEFLDSRGHQIAVFTRADLQKWGRRDVPPVLVLSQTGVSLASFDYWKQWQRELSDQRTPAR